MGRISMRRVALAIALVGALLPLGVARAADAQINFLNPSGYSPTITISDKADKDQAIHLVAWVSSVPASPIVEFEMQPTVGVAITLDATRVGNDTWETFASVTNMADGTYTLRAILYSNLSESDSAEQQVTLNRTDVPPPPAETVEMSHPTNGGSLGFFTPAGKRTTTMIDTVASEGAEQVRALYTTSAPGTVPTWVACGAKSSLTEKTPSVRCTLATGVSGSQVTAVAVVANNTPPPSEPNPVADDSGDAHRIIPYVQKPTDVDVAPETGRSDVAKCILLSATFTDQFLQPIAGANVDVHAVGPSDQVRFGTIARATSPTAPVLTSAFQAPDKGHVAQQDGIDCGGRNDPAGRQGDHNVPGGNDPQHIESTTGTDDDGKFIFALYSDSNGGTNVTVYMDEDDDDVLDASEASGGARIGWGQDAPEPTTELFFDPRTSAATSGECVRVVLVAKRGGNALLNTNVDVHASGPDASVTFCTPADASVSRPPDQAHTGNADDADTRHVEGETNNLGQFIFGVTATSSGTTELVGWIDSPDDDLQSTGETTATGLIQWDISGQRTISIASNKSAVRSGRRVQITGAIDGAPACETTQVVNLQRKRVSGGRFKTFMTTTTDAEGGYLFSVQVKASKKYRVLAPAADPCVAAQSRSITVRAT